MKDLKKAIVLTASFYGRSIEKEVLEMYVADLSDLPEAECIKAYHAWRVHPESRTFPLPSQIRKLVNPHLSLTNQEIASEISSRITGAVPKFGYANPAEAKSFIGEVGWEVVQRRGGWGFICRNLGVTLNPSTFEAQVRKQIETSLVLGSKVSNEDFDKLGLTVRASSNLLEKDHDLEDKKTNTILQLENLAKKTVK